MKSMTCKQLGGACDHVFTAESFDDIAAQSKKHAMEMFQQGDAAHLEAMNAMKDLMQNPQAMQDWFMQKKQEFEILPDDQP